MTKNILGSTSSTQNMMANDEKSSVQMITENMAVNSNEVNVSNQNVDDDQGSKQDPEMSGVSKLDITKKKTAFQITSVRVKNMSEVDADSYSMDDLEESHTEDVSSDMLDYSRNTDVEPDAASVDTLHNFPINPSDSFNEHILRNDSVSRFRVVKLESKEPFRKGRWQCHDYLEPNVERSDSKVEQEGGSGNSSAASSVHYVPGVDDPAKNPITISKQLSDGQTLVEPQPVYPSQSINGQSDLQTSGGQVTNQSIQQHSQSTSHYQSNTQEVQSTNIVQPQPPNISQPPGPHDDIGLNQSTYDIGQSPANVSNNEYTNIDYTIQAPTPQADLSHSTEQQAQSVSVSKQNVHSTTTPPRQESTPPIQTQAQAPSNAQQSSDQEQRYDHVAKNGTSDLNVSQSQPESTAALDSSTSVPDSTTVAPATQPSVTLSTASVTDQVVDSNVGGAVSTSDVTEQGTVVPPRNSTTSPDDDVFTKETDPPTPAGVAGPREIKQEKAAKPVTVDTNIPTTQNTPSVLLSLGSSRGTAQTLLTPPLLEIVGGSSLDEKEGAEGGASTVAIDNKIEQAMDLVKSHLMFAVKEEVDVLREQIKELMEKNSQLEHENALLRSSATPETLTKLKQQANHPPTSTS